VKKRPGMRAIAVIGHPQGQPELDRAVVVEPGGRLLVFGGTPTLFPWVDQAANLVVVDSSAVTLHATGWQGGVDATTNATLTGAYLIQRTAAGIQHAYHTTNANPAANAPNATAPGWDTANFPGPVFSAPAGGMVALAERIYAVDGQLVRMSDVVDVRNWLPPTGNQTQLAGYLNVGLHQSGGEKRPTALGRYRDKLVVFFPNSTQIWTTDPQPSLHKLDTMVDGVGCRWPRATTNIAGDCLALDDSGIRSISIVDAFGNIADVDIGAAVDALVVQAIGALAGMTTPGVEPCAVYAPALRQAWFAIGQEVYVFSFSRTAQVAAWSRYTMPAPVVWMEERGGVPVVRCRFQQPATIMGQACDYYDVVYVPDEARYADDIYDPATNAITAQPFQVRAELPFLSLGAPGALKTLYGWDIVLHGTATVSFRLDPANPDVATPPVEVAGDTRPGASMPLQASSVFVQPVIEDLDDRPWELSAITIYFASRGLR